MPNLNRITICGHLGRDPEVRYTQAGKAVCSFSVATNSGKGDYEKTEWHNIIVWGDRGAKVADEFRKGDAILILDGEKTTRQYTTRDGENRTVTEITCPPWCIISKPIYAKRDTGSEATQGHSSNDRGATGPTQGDGEEIPF